MRTTKIAILAVGLALLASCKKDKNTGDNAPENGFRATIEQPANGGGSGERTHINPDWGNENATSVYWSEGDLIKVANQSGSALTFQLTEGENTTSGTFYAKGLPDGFFEPDYVAIYPAANAEETDNTISGTTATFDAMNKYFTISQMPVVSSTYWNMVHGNSPDEVRQDAEGLQTMRNLGRNMAWLLQCIERSGIPAPEAERGNWTSFIR